MDGTITITLDEYVKLAEFKCRLNALMDILYSFANLSYDGKGISFAHDDEILKAFDPIRYEKEYRALMEKSKKEVTE